MVYCNKHVLGTVSFNERYINILMGQDLQIYLSISNAIDMELWRGEFRAKPEYYIICPLKHHI